ncbi:MAG: hypothetical protein KGL52_08410 [Rhodospirillales bacterium]|nr:hypothetical protein [Rhodospirillales bacterium]
MTRPTRRAAWLLVAAASFGMAATPALAAGGRPIGFYGDIGNAVGGQTPMMSPPSTLLLTEDGSVALVHLHWHGWGTGVARASGVWSASSCMPSCATGKLTKRPARLTLSRPGMVNGHRVYRCFQVEPPHKARDIADHACLRGPGASVSYAPVSGG